VPPGVSLEGVATANQEETASESCSATAVAASECVSTAISHDTSQAEELEASKEKLQDDGHNSNIKHSDQAQSASVPDPSSTEESSGEEIMSTSPKSDEAGDDISTRELQEHFDHQEERDVSDNDKNKDEAGQESSCKAAASAVVCSPPEPCSHKRDAAPDSDADPEHHQAKRVRRLLDNMPDKYVAQPVETSSAEPCQEMGPDVISGATSKELLPEDQACSDADDDNEDSATKQEEAVGLVAEESESDTMTLGEVKACECAPQQTDAPEETKTPLASEELAVYTHVPFINKREADESCAEAFEVDHEVKRARHSTSSSQDCGDVDSTSHMAATTALHNIENQDLANETEVTGPTAGAVDDPEVSVSDVGNQEENSEEHSRPAKRARTHSEEREG